MLSSSPAAAVQRARGNDSVFFGRAYRQLAGAQSLAYGDAQFLQPAARQVQGNPQAGRA